MNNKAAPLVSFFVMTYNVGRYLGACLESILSQECDVNDYEVILVDDASTDNTEEVARSFTDPRIRYVRHEHNRGHIASFNEGLGLCGGAFIARIDSDDYYRPHFLRETLNVLRGRPEVGVVYGNVALINEQGEVTQECPEWFHQGLSDNTYLELIENHFIPAPTVMARREAWQETLPLPDGMGFSDWYQMLRMARKYKFHYLNSILADYRVHSQGLHVTMIKNKTEEPTVFRILDDVFNEPEYAKEKTQMKKRVYGRAYLNLADKYFGSFMNSDARRCYLSALRYKPEYVFNPGVTRRLLATVIGRGLYEKGKLFIRGHANASGPSTYPLSRGE